MPLETATYTHDLVTANPAHSDGLNNADAHMRLIKSTLQNTFPNFISAPLNSTQAQIDAAAGAVNTTGVTKLSESGAMFATNTTDGLTNPVAGTVGIETGGSVATTFTAGGIGTAAINASGAISGASISGKGIVPVGGMIMWLTDTLPTDGGVWAWANGQAISRTTYATLFGLWSTTYGAGDGSTTFNVINMQDVVPVGKDTMGGAASPGLLTSIAAGVKQALGSLFGADSSTLATANLPPYTPAGSVSTSITNGGSILQYGSTSGFTSGVGYAFNIVTITASSTFTGTAQGGSSTAFTNCQPSKVVNFIIRIA